ncbi:hypothetical protein [Maricaulis sp.]|uniref:hypothetical protein n=1 Tax=Maricaulis sp. TaxID=1486257 RepID=UPI003A8CC5FD
MITSRPGSALARFVLLPLRTLAAILVGFALTTWLAGQLWVDPGAGLAAAPEAMGDGLGGALIAGLIAATAGHWLPAARLNALTLVCLLLAAGLAVFIAYRAVIVSGEAVGDPNETRPVTQLPASGAGPE